MFRLRWAHVTLVLLGLLPPAAISATAEQISLFFGHDDRRAVPMTAMPWRAIGNLETRGNTVCSGSLVASDLVLTAAHCFFESGPGFDRPLRFILPNGRRAAVADWRYPAAFRRGIKIKGQDLIIKPQAAPYDYALLRLAKPLASAGQWLSLAPAEQLAAWLRQAHWQVDHAGFPEDSNDVLLAHRACLVSALQSDGTLTHRCDTLKGDSGSPLLLQRDRQWWLLAVQSSAPDAAEREKADNIGVSAVAWQRQVEAWRRQWGRVSVKAQPR